MGLKARWVLIVLILAWSIYAITPLDKKINLGLDLQGGIHVLLDVDTDKAIEGKIDNVVPQIRKEFKEADIEAAYVKKNSMDSVAIGITDNAMREQALKLLGDNYPYLVQAGAGAGNSSIIMAIEHSTELRWRQDAVDQSIEILRNRIDAFGVAEPLIQKQGERHIVVQLPGIQDPQKAIELIGQTAVLTFHFVDTTVSQEDIANNKLPYGTVALKVKGDESTGHTHAEGFEPKIAVKSDPVLTGSFVADAEIAISPENNQPYVSLTFDAAGARLFEEITKNNVGKNLAIVLDGNVYSYPTIREPISGGKASISGAFNMAEAKNLSIALKAGSLPAPVSIIENRTVGASLGDDSIRSGVTASIVGFILIVLFIGIYYRLSGMVANIALLMNLVLILAVLAQFGATLTLPGIAGIMLTLGMAVDANVLIFERIREELRGGRTPLNAIEVGYAKALSAIIDSNLTTLIAAVVLFQFGTGPVKGFAVTLSVGLIASMFTAIFVTRTIFMSFMAKRSISKLSI